MKVLITEQQLRTILNEQSSGGLIPPLGYKIIYDIEHAYSFTTRDGKISGWDYDGTEKESFIKKYLESTIGLDNWNKLNDLFKVQLYSYMYQHDSGDGGMRMWWVAGLAQAIDPKINRDDIKYKPLTNPNVVNAIKIIKEACEDGSINSYYKKWLSVVDEQMRGTGSDHKDNYKNVWKNRPRAIERLMNGESWDVVKKEFNSTDKQVKTDDKTKNTKIKDDKKIVGKDNMYNRLVKTFGSKIVKKDNDEKFVIKFPNKDDLNIYVGKNGWNADYYPNKIGTPPEDYYYYYSNGILELIGDLDFKITFYDDGSYDSQTKKWNGSLDVKPIPNRENANDVIQSNKIFKKLYKLYGKNVKISTDYGNKTKRRLYDLVLEFSEDEFFKYFPTSGTAAYFEGDKRINSTFESVGEDNFKFKLSDGRIFDTKTNKWSQGKPFETVNIIAKDMNEFASEIKRQTKNKKIDLNSLRLDGDNFKLSVNITEDGTQVYELFLLLPSSKLKPSTILSNYPNSKIIAKGNFPNKPENNYTLIAIII